MFVQLMDRMELSIHKHGPYFTKLGQKDSSSDNRALVLMTPFSPQDQVHAFLVVSMHGFRMMYAATEELPYLQGALERHREETVALSDRVDLTSGFGGYHINQNEVESVTINGTHKRLQDLPVGTDAKELIIRSMEEERARLQEFVDAEKQEEEMARSVLIALFPNTPT